MTIHDFLHRKLLPIKYNDVDTQLECYRESSKECFPCSYHCLCRDDAMWLTYPLTRIFLSPLKTDTFRRVLNVVSSNRKNSWLTGRYYDSLLTYFVAAMFCDFYNLNQYYPKFANERYGSWMIDTGTAQHLHSFCIMSKKMKYIEGEIHSSVDLQMILSLSKLVLKKVFHKNDKRDSDLMLYINKRSWMAPNKYVLTTADDNKVVAYTVHLCTFLHRVFAFGEENLFPPISGLEIVWRCGASIFYREKSSSSMKRLTLLQGKRTKMGRELLSAIEPTLLAFIQTLINNNQTQQTLVCEPKNGLLSDALSQLLVFHGYCGEGEIMKYLQFNNPLLAPPLLSNSYFVIAHTVSRYYARKGEETFPKFSERFAVYLKTLMTYFYAALLCDSGHFSDKNYHHHKGECQPTFSGIYDAIDEYVKMEAPSDDEMCKLWGVTSHILKYINVTPPVQLFGNDEVKMHRMCVFSNFERSRLPYNESLILTIYVARLCFYLQMLYTFRNEYLTRYHDCGCLSTNNDCCCYLYEPLAT